MARCDKCGRHDAGLKRRTRWYMLNYYCSVKCYELDVADMKGMTYEEYLVQRNHRIDNRRGL